MKVPMKAVVAFLSLVLTNVVVTLTQNEVDGQVMLPQTADEWLTLAATALVTSLIGAGLVYQVPKTVTTSGGKHETM